jgi:hypothetical protein
MALRGKFSPAQLLVTRTIQHLEHLEVRRGLARP